MRYMDQEVTHIRQIDVDRYRHNYESCCEKFTYLMPINKEKYPQLKILMQALWEFYYFLTFSLDQEH